MRDAQTTSLYHFESPVRAMIRALIASTKSIRLDRTRGAWSYANAGVLRQGSSRCFSDVETSNAETPESKMESILRDELGANHVVVEDISGGLRFDV